MSDSFHTVHVKHYFGYKPVLLIDKGKGKGKGKGYILLYEAAFLPSVRSHFLMSAFSSSSKTNEIKLENDQDTTNS